MHSNTLVNYEIVIVLTIDYSHNQIIMFATCNLVYIAQSTNQFLHANTKVIYTVITYTIILKYVS